MTLTEAVWKVPMEKTMRFSRGSPRVYAFISRSYSSMTISVYSNRSEDWAAVDWVEDDCHE